MMMATTPHAQAVSQTVKCDYKFMNAQFSTVTFIRYDDGTISPSAEVVPPGGSPVHKEPLTQVAAQPGELLHAWLSKGIPDSELEMIIYEKPQSKGRSKLINANIPIGREIWGDCDGI